jgi:hypothetical protein
VTPLSSHDHRYIHFGPPFPSIIGFGAIPVLSFCIVSYCDILRSIGFGIRRAARVLQIIVIIVTEFPRNHHASVLERESAFTSYSGVLYGFRISHTLLFTAHYITFLSLLHQAARTLFLGFLLYNFSFYWLLERNILAVATYHSIYSVYYIYIPFLSSPYSVGLCSFLFSLSYAKHFGKKNFLFLTRDTKQKAQEPQKQTFE